MKVAEYSGYDALGLAELVAKKQVSPKELAQTAVAARDKVDSVVRAGVGLDPHSGELVRRRRAQAVAHARVGRPRGGRGRLGLFHELRADEDRARRGRDARLRVDPAAGRSLHHSEARRALRLARRQGAATA